MMKIVQKSGYLVLGQGTYRMVNYVPSVGKRGVIISKINMIPITVIDKLLFKKVISIIIL